MISRGFLSIDVILWVVAGYRQRGESDMLHCKYRGILPRDGIRF